VSESGSIPVGEERERIAIELSLCQAHVDNSSQRVWQSGAIILAGGLAALGLMLAINESDLASAIITTIFSVGAIVVLQSWQYLVLRERQLQKVSIKRMGDLEDLLRLRREDLIQDRDEELSQDFEDLILGRTTTDRLVRISQFIQVGWVLVAVWRWLIYAGVLD
jgi:hypothetical protein